MSEEILTTYDAFNQPLGSANRSDIHRNGLWHRSVNFIVVDPKKKTAIFQDSNALDTIDADKFFVKMNGGHAHDEDMLVEVSRELEEELGLKINNAEDVHFLGKYQISFEPTEEFINHEFMYFYLTAFSDVFEKIEMDGEEVKSIFEINIDEAVDLIVGDRDSIEVMARDYLGNTVTQNFTRHSFRNFTDDSLYFRLFLAMQDFCNGRNKKHIVI
jgi:isopentenyldiphosphate isomerase